MPSFPLLLLLSNPNEVRSENWRGEEVEEEERMKEEVRMEEKEEKGEEEDVEEKD